MLDIHPLVWVYLAVPIVVVAAVVVLTRGWFWVERCLLATAILSSLSVLRSLLTLGDPSMALAATGVSFGLLALARADRSGGVGS